MQNRKSADVDIIVGWNVGTATQCAGFIGNIRAKHSSAAAAGWNTFQTTRFALAAIGAIKSPRHQPGKILNWCLVFLTVHGSPFAVRSSRFAVGSGHSICPMGRISPILPCSGLGPADTLTILYREQRTANGQRSTLLFQLVDDRKDIVTGRAWLELPVLVYPAGRHAS